MVAYKDYLALSRSLDSGDRGQAAHLAASAFISHAGPADEYAALYAAIMGFLDDASVKVRAALAYGLLHSPRAPRPVMLALLNDAPIIARAVARYSPILLEADLLGCLKSPNTSLEEAISSRENIGPSLVRMLMSRQDIPVILNLLERSDISIDAQVFQMLISVAETQPNVRGALLAREDLPARVRLALVEQVKNALRNLRIVKGAVAPRRLARILRDADDQAITRIVDEDVSGGDISLIEDLIEDGRLSVRLMLNALINGRVQFFSSCLSQLGEMPQSKVISILERGSRPALKAMFDRSGLGAEAGELLISLVSHARTSNLADDVAARYLIVTILIDELIIEHDGIIPDALCDSFAYLNEQNTALARSAARGVMNSFAANVAPERALPIQQSQSRELMSAAA